MAVFFRHTPLPYKDRINQAKNPLSFFPKKVV